MSTNFAIPEWVEGQAHPEVTTNAAIALLDAALTELFSCDLAAGDVTLTNAQFRQNIKFKGINCSTTGRDIIIPAIKRMFAVESASANTNDFNVTRGTTSIVVSPGEFWLFFSDGTANGLTGTAMGGSGGATLPNGGADGTVLTKQSAADQDFDWEAPTGGSGAAYNAHFRGTIVVPVAADFPTWVNQDGASITDQTDRTVLNSGTPNTGVSLQCRVRSLPGAPWTVELGCHRLWPLKNFFDGGLILRESGTGKIESAGFGPGGELQQVKWSSATAASAVRFTQNSGYSETPILYFRASFATPNITFYASHDGITWFQYGATFAQTNFFTTAPDQWGFFINNNNSATPNINMDLGVFHWDE